MNGFWDGVSTAAEEDADACVLNAAAAPGLEVYWDGRCGAGYVVRDREEQPSGRCRCGAATDSESIGRDRVEIVLDPAVGADIASKTVEVVGVWTQHASASVYTDREQSRGIGDHCCPEEVQAERVADEHPNFELCWR